MITVVSLNPSIDRTLSLPFFAPGGTNRAEDVRIDAGGKGINVCLHLKALGAGDVRCIGFMRSADEALFTDTLKKAGVHCLWQTLPGHVRTNTKICTRDGGLTEINEAGAQIPDDALVRLLAQYSEICRDAGVIVLTGSVPPGVPKDIYRQMIDIAHAHGAVCLLDADGEALRQGLLAKPDFIKPNRAEAESLLNVTLTDEVDLISTAKSLLAMGIAYGCISLGAQGALYFSDAWTLALPALDVDVQSTVGAGDAMTAAFSLGLSRKMGEKETFRLAVAASAAAVTTKGTQPVSLQLTEKLLKQTMHSMREC